MHRRSTVPGECLEIITFPGISEAHCLPTNGAVFCLPDRRCRPRVDADQSAPCSVFWHAHLFLSTPGRKNAGRRVCAVSCCCAGAGAGAGAGCWLLLQRRTVYRMVAQILLYVSFNGSLPANVCSASYCQDRDAMHASSDVRCVDRRQPKKHLQTTSHTQGELAPWEGPGIRRGELPRSSPRSRRRLTKDYAGACVLGGSSRMPVFRWGQT
jgi:hypothetical protein